MDRTTAYAKKVVNKEILKGKTEYLCCKRHLDDMAKGKDFPFIFDVELAERAISIDNELVLISGTEEQPLKTRGFQDFIIGSLNGWRWKYSTKLRYREAYVQMGRQNGKSLIAGTMANQKASFSGYKYSRIFCTATKMDQAAIVWDEVAKFITADKDLRNLYKVTKHDNTITSLISGNYIKALGRDTKSADGFTNILAIIDEYHAHPTNEMYNLMLDGQISIESPLTFAITTAGFNLMGPCYEQYTFAKQVLFGLVEKESLFIYIAEMDEDDDIWDYNNWAKSNPLLLWNEDDTYNKEIIHDMAEKAISAKEKGGQDLFNFMTKSLNVWVKYSGESYIDMEAFEASGCDLTLEDMKGRKTWIGLDLSSGGDLTSVVFIFPHDEDKFFLHQHSFMPELTIEGHEHSDAVPYRIWAKQGLITLTTGGFGLKTDYKFVIAYLKKIVDEYGLEVQGIGYDPHNASTFVDDLEIFNCEITEINQSARSLNDATVDLKLSIQANQILYNKNDALMKWAFANARTTHNSFDEIKIKKERNEARIDVVDAAIDGWKLIFMNKDGLRYNANDDFDEWKKMMEELRR